MEYGKRICRTLKELRKRIADANDIPFEIEECSHQGDCPGTCPKCEVELRFLMDSIDRREQEGKAIHIDGLMSEEELRQVFSIEPAEQGIPENPDDMMTMGVPSPPEPEVLIGDIEPLQGLPMPYPTYDFAAKIAKVLLTANDKNFVFSPAGLCRILKMLCEGMDDRTKIYEIVCDLIDGFNSEIETIDDEEFKLEHASSIWYNKLLGAIKEGYLGTLEDAYEAQAHNADFTQKTKTKLWIDKWVSDNTHKKIKSLDAEISEDALMLVLDAIYMNGKWENPFDPDFTETDTFHNADGTETDVEMMYQDIDNVEYVETYKYQVVCLPYRNNDYRMVIVLPKEGVDLDSLMKNPDWIDEETEAQEVELYMPRFKFENTLSFKEVLSELGLGDMFDKEDSFPKITELPAHISQIKQQCVMAVEEEGTEAAAVTLAECEVGCLPPDDMPENIVMKLDRPFGFAIKGDLGQLLFMGVVRHM